MAIDLANERIIDALKEGPSYLGAGRGGRPPHRSFMVRAITQGMNGQRLEALRVGSRWLTSVEALQRWADAQTDAKLVGPVTTPSVTRRRASEHAERELDRLGFEALTKLVGRRPPVRLEHHQRFRSGP